MITHNGDAKQYTQNSPEIQIKERLIITTPPPPPAKNIQINSHEILSQAANTNVCQSPHTSSPNFHEFNKRLN
jgi:hypothetical protein